MSNLVDILIPTFNNRQYLDDTVYSLLKSRPSEGLSHIYIINNGHPDSCRPFYSYHNDVSVIETGGENFGWMKAINLGIKQSKAPFICMCNDDIYVPYSSFFWINTLLQHFLDDSVAGVGPSSNIVMGLQNIFSKPDLTVFTTKFLIGFCVLYRREAIEKVGLLDETLPGGDDFDYGIRMTNAGYKLIVNRNVFIYHHGFKTGERVIGTSNKKMGWNSFEYTELVNLALIKKHGFRKWYELMKSTTQLPSINRNEVMEDKEGNIIRTIIRGDKVVEMGCGCTKTVERAVGVDMIAKNNPIDTIGKVLSVADVVADVAQPLPFEDESIDCMIGRHILEHILDPIETLRNWHKKIKKSGQLIIAVPNDSLIRSIPYNIEHRHGYNMNSIKNLLEIVGFKVNQQIDTKNNISFVTEAIKI